MHPGFRAWEVRTDSHASICFWFYLAILPDRAKFFGSNWIAKIMLTDAFEQQQNGVKLSDTLSDVLKDYPSQSRSERSRSLLPRLQCFRPSSSKDNPNRTQLRKQLSEAQIQYQHASQRSEHAETALSGSVSETMRLEHDKKVAEAQAEQAAREVQQLQRALQDSEARAAAVSQRVQQDVQLLTMHVKELADQAYRVSTQLRTARGDSISRLMQTAWEGGTDLNVTDSFQVSDALVSLQDLHQDLDRAQQQVSLLESSTKGCVLADWQAQQDLQAELLSLQSQQWWAPQLAKGSVGLGYASIGGVWWVTKGVTKVCLIPASLVQRVFDIAKRDHQSIAHAPYPQPANASQQTYLITDGHQQARTSEPDNSNPMLGRSVSLNNVVP